MTRAKEIVRGDINAMSSRAAMGLSGDYGECTAEYPGKDITGVLPSVKILVELLTSQTAAIDDRFYAGLLLALRGDPRINTLDPVMCDIVAGETSIGLDPCDLDRIAKKYEHIGVKPEWIAKECPRFRVQLSGFRMAKYPVTNTEYRDYLLNCPDGEIPTSWIFGRFPVNRANHPVETLSVEACESYIRWLNRVTGRMFRLPTEYEWEYAASGSQQREFPWGDDFHVACCNTVESGLLSTTPVGMFPQGVSPFGCEDMAGNVEEYVADNYHAYPNGDFIPDDLVLTQGTYRIARGGSFTRFRDLARCKRRHGRYQSDLYVMGFRLAETIDAGELAD